MMNHNSLSFTVQIPRATSSRVHLDSDIKSQASNFVQKLFGNVRNISISDKKSVERWIGEWLQNERKGLNEAFEIAASSRFIKLSGMYQSDSNLPDSKGTELQTIDIIVKVLKLFKRCLGILKS